jgi:hypothetical protein
MMKLKVKHDVNVEFERVYRDRITGFTGKCAATAKYVFGCDQVQLITQANSDGKYESGWFDDERLIDVEAEKAVVRSSRRGGPQRAGSLTERLGLICEQLEQWKADVLAHESSSAHTHCERISMAEQTEYTQEQITAWLRDHPGCAWT